METLSFEQMENIEEGRNQAAYESACVAFTLSSLGII